MAPKRNYNYGISSFPVTMFAHLLAIAVTILVLVWLLHFREGLAFKSDNKQKIFNVHPLLMVIGFVLFSGQAIMAYKTVPARRNIQKIFHLILHMIALAAGIVGIYAVFKFHNETGIADIYTLHSWLGISTICLFGLQKRCILGYGRPFDPTSTSAEGEIRLKEICIRIPRFILSPSIFSILWLFSFFSLWYPGAKPSTRERLVPWHALFGMVIFLMGILSAETGLVERFTFLSLRRNQEALVVNFTGLLILLFAISVGFTTLLHRAY